MRLAFWSPTKIRFDYKLHMKIMPTTSEKASQAGGKTNQTTAATRTPPSAPELSGLLRQASPATPEGPSPGGQFGFRQMAALVDGSGGIRRLTMSRRQPRSMPLILLAILIQIAIGIVVYLALKQ
jgi:hypothetical protein